ncbi:MAG: zinc ribbon domain-containing protein [Chloroflexi bacterium]|nr:zinc ribbon domain-containing protein [Chloroflexota bacterium]
MKKTWEDVFTVAISLCFDACYRLGDQLGWQSIKLDSSAYMIQWRPALSLMKWGVGEYVTISLEPVDTSHTRVSFTYQNLGLADPFSLFDKRMTKYSEPFRMRLNALAQPPPPTLQGPTCPACGTAFAAGTRFCPNDGNPLAPDHLTQQADAFCANCGARLSKGTRFCPDCGATQKEATLTRGKRVTTCEIVFVQTASGLTGAKGCFEAKAIGPSGTYSAGLSQVFQTGLNASGPDIKASNKQVMELHRELIDRLVNEGWEPTGDRGAEWWNQRFRRQIA